MATMMDDIEYNAMWKDGMGKGCGLWIKLLVFNSVKVNEFLCEPMWKAINVKRWGKSIHHYREQIKQMWLDGDINQE